MYLGLLSKLCFLQTQVIILAALLLISFLNKKKCLLVLLQLMPLPDSFLLVAVNFKNVVVLVWTTDDNESMTIVLAFSFCMCHAENNVVTALFFFIFLNYWRLQD